MTIKYLIVVFFFIGTLPNGFSCSCGKTPDTFIENLNYEYIVHAKILEHVKYDSETQYSRFYGITKLLVLESIKTKVKLDTLIYLNNSPSLCGSTIFHLEQGTEVLLKGNSSYYYGENILNPTKQDSFFYEKINNSITITGGPCDVCTIQVSNGKAIGNITRNNKKFVYGMYKIIKFFSTKLGKTFYHKNLRDKHYNQKIKISKVIRILKRSV